MLRMQTLVLFAWLAVLAGTSRADEPAAAKAPTNTDSAKLIADALAKAKAQPAAEQLEAFRAVAKAVQEKCPQNVLVAEQLQAANSREELQAALRKSYEMLTFQLKKEADLPTGFPDPTPVGEIRVKQYPAYRLARTPSKKDSGFFKLFTHITVNRIEMTAPVEMTYNSDVEKGPEQIDMAFLYGDPKIGKTGDKLGDVTVSDIPAMTTVSLGLMGNNERAKLAEVERRLEGWLAQHSAEYERAGKLRLLGYNSPQVRADSRYYEVELPIKKK